MFKVKCKFLSFVSIMAFSLLGCNNTASDSIEQKSAEEKESSIVESISPETPLSTFIYSDYDNVQEITDLEGYINDTQGENQYLADTNGVIVSPYYTLKVNDIDVPVYATRVEKAIHSFCYLLVKEDTVNLNLEITSFQDMESAVVLPISSGISSVTNGKITTANINDFGTFSFGFNDTNTWGLTFMVAKYEKFSVPDGYSIEEYSPKDYSKINQGSLSLTKENTAYYFSKGHYILHDIKIGSNVEIYFEPGTYIEDYIYYNKDGTSSDTSTFMSSSGTENVRIYGNALFDFASHIGGGPTPIYKRMYDFVAVSDFEFKGTISIDSCSWTLCFTDSSNLEVDWNLLLSYKQCSDGIMISDSQDSIIHHNFCRVGDDGIEAKSTGSHGSKNLIYEYNAVWADKARCYGCIYEANKDMEEITFRHNSVGYSKPHWANYGCLVIAMGDNKNTTWHDIHFEDTEIYYTTNKILAMYAQAANEKCGGIIKNIYFKDITCYCPFDQHGELVYIDICEDSKMGKCYIENFMYKNEEGKMVQYVDEDKSNETLTHINVSHQYSLKNIVVS